MSSAPDRRHTLEGVNPITLLVTAVRGLMAGAASPGQLTWVLVTCAVLVGVFGPLTMWRYRTRD